jgi:2-dehydro-3-deoxyphosphogluconate aldolase/(4S)-4-hydroxy-2-oxoglutarate aldolase
MARRGKIHFISHWRFFEGRIVDVRSVLRLAPVIPVLTIRQVKDAVPLARALVQGGLRVLEVTLRTEAALQAMERIAGEVPEAIVAAGTILSSLDLERSARAGARLAFSPGLADFMLEPGAIPLIPGIATPTELMKAGASGLSTFKFFPAAPAGGVGALKAFAGPFAHVAFCPTGGVDAGNARQFLDLPNVLCVGGSWVAPMGAIEAQDWALIETLAGEARRL